MKLDQTQQRAMLEASRPLLKWMNENCDPHCKIIVDQGSVELLEGVAGHHTDEFIQG